MRYIILSLILLGSIGIDAQPITANTYDDMLETGDTALAGNNYFNAIEWYEKAYKEERNPNTALAIADLYVLTRNYQRAESWYKRILRRDKENQLVDIRYDYGKVFKAQGKYREALNEFNTVISLSEDPQLVEEAKKELKGIEMMGDIADNIDAVVTYAGNKVNSASGDFSPRLYDDGSLYYASFARRKEIVLDGKEDDYHVKIFSARRNDKGVYDDPEELPQSINRKGYHTANVAFSEDGRTMYFTRAKLEGNEIGESRIYMASKDDEGWGAALEVPGVNGNYVAKHPIVGELFGNKVLFFVSDMDGGYGGDDIYYSTIRGDEYSSPVNLGEKINTSRDEVTPYYKDGTLYFSSTGHPTMGGYDIFYSIWNGSEWGDPVNMGFNYNTSYDDLYFNMNEGGTKGFLVSNRIDKDKRSLKGKTCCDDIYTIEIRDVVVDLLALVEDENGALNGATIELIDNSVDGGNPTSKTNISSNNFSFLLESDHSYIARVTREGYYPDSVEFNTVGILDDYTVKKTVVLNPKPEEKEETEIVTINQPIRLNNIYYEFDKDNILPEAEPDLEYLVELMDQYSDMVIELSSHTDAQGISTYNQDLSQRRAESAKVWLMDAGIAEDRIKPVGYGESQILNKCVNGVRCSDDEHRYNRRTEFKIIAGPQSIEIKKSIQGDYSNPEKKN
ncbi:MAG: OmpA family protein [Saprospiraceae bacterium]|nr:OmpA family protein [Saprospiraceae bacterium]